MNDDLTSYPALPTTSVGDRPPKHHSFADFDEADYRPYLEGLALTDEQASELLRILWDMMRMFIEMDVPAETWGQIVSPLFVVAAADSAAVE